MTAVKKSHARRGAGFFFDTRLELSRRESDTMAPSTEKDDLMEHVKMNGKNCARWLPVLAGLFAVAHSVCAQQDLCTLELKVTDANGASLPYRGYLKNAGGKTIYPEGAIHFEHVANYEERHFLADAPLQLSLPAGTYTLRVERGLEWKPEERTIQLQSAKPAVVHIIPERWVDMNALGWYSGDMHLHRYPRDLEVALLAEDLNFGANQTLWNRGDAYKANQLPLPAARYQFLGAVTAPLHVINTRSQETERLGNSWGAANFLGDYEPVRLPADPYYPLTAMVCKEARERGAHIDLEKPVWKDTPICAALGLVDSIGIVHNHFHPGTLLPMKLVRDAIVPPPSLEMTPREMARYTLQLYDHLLNCGLRIPVSGGTASGVMGSWPGYARTYVKLDAPFSPQAWLEQLRAGRSFATCGPLLFLKVGTHEPGAVVQVKRQGQKMRVQVQAQSQFPRLELLEVVHNGKVVASATENGAGDLSIDKEIRLGPGWVSARAFETEGKTQVFAATSPVYFEHGGDRGIVPESACYYAGIVREMIAQAQAEKRFTEGQEEQTALGLLNQALEFYESRCK